MFVQAAEVCAEEDCPLTFNTRTTVQANDVSVVHTHTVHSILMYAKTVFTGPLLNSVTGQQILIPLDTVFYEAEGMM